MNNCSHKAILLLLFAALCIGCQTHDGLRKMPFVYAPDIRQGNLIEQDTINKLQAGMSKEQVLFILGTPTIIDPFHSQRWVYLYLIEKRLEARIQQHLSLIFKDDKLVKLEGDVRPGQTELSFTKERQFSVSVPKEYAQKNLYFWERIFNKIRSP